MLNQIRLFVSLGLLTIGLTAQNTVSIKLKTGNTVQGEFVGTYMNYVHLLSGENVAYFSCNNIESITLYTGQSFVYDCNANTVTADILFPPELDPMTGEWVQNIPEVFNPKPVKLAPEPEVKVQQLPDSKKSNTLSLDQYMAKTKSEEGGETLTEEKVRNIVRQEIAMHEARKHKAGMNQDPFENEQFVQIVLGCCVAWFLSMMVVG